MPWSLAVWDQHLYVVDSGDKIVVFDKQGTFVKNIDGAGAGGQSANKPHFKNPKGIAFDGDGNMYVSNSGRYAGVITVFDKNGVFIRKLGHCNPFQPEGLAVCSSGYVYAACGKQVVIMDKTGIHVRSVPAEDARVLCVDGEGKICTTGTGCASLGGRFPRGSIVIC